MAYLTVIDAVEDPRLVAHDADELDMPLLQAASALAPGGHVPPCPNAA